MPAISPIFSQITQTLLWTEFARCAEQFPMPRTSRSFSAYDHYLALCFGQLTYRESLRDIVGCLQACPSLHYHLGFRGKITRTNLAYANQHRDWRVFAAVAEILMRRATRCYADDVDSELELPRKIFALDASIIHLSVNLFPWTYWARSRAGAMKLHTLLALRGSYPVWATITEAHIPDMKLLDEIPVLPGAFYVMDRGYLDFPRLWRFHSEEGFFVVRSKRHVNFHVVTSRPVDKTSGLRCDQTIKLVTKQSRKAYPKQLRRIKFFDEAQKRYFVFLTNNSDLPALVICELYKKRWLVELFFKWIKQHLRIRNYFGRTDNAVRCQIWTAICTYLMVAIARKELGIKRSLNEMLQIISAYSTEQIALMELLAKTPISDNASDDEKSPYLLGLLTGH